MNLGLPIDYKSNSDLSGYGIDMSNLNFKVDKDKQILASLIYIRNCGLKNKLDFSKCDYSIKENFLLTYMQKNIVIIDNSLCNTWSVILNNDNINDDLIYSILNIDEIELFRKNNSDFILNIKQFINSLMVYKTYAADADHFHLNIDLASIKHSEYDNISIGNLYKLLRIHSYLFITIEDTDIFFYDKLFVDEYKFILLSIISASTPYNELLSLIFNTLKLGEK